jgi:ABC-type transport system involved in cytochrome bd biosynthesis fused ATPase/permease subunit
VQIQRWDFLYGEWGVLTLESVVLLSIIGAMPKFEQHLRIYVLAGGRIVQQGRFEDLAQQAGVFAHLMARQMLTA